jgi:hypothetical protein
MLQIALAGRSVVDPFTGQERSAASVAIELEKLTRRQEYQRDQALLLANVYKDLMSTYDQMFSKFAGGFARAITEGKNFGSTLMGVLHQVESEILTKLIGTALNQLRDILGKLLLHVGGGIAGAIGGGIGGALGKVAGGAAAGAPAAATQTANTAALTGNTAALVTNTAGLTAAAAASTAVATGDVTLVAAVTFLAASVDFLAASVDANTIALYATGFIPFAQEGGTVARSGVAVIHAGETVANKNILRGIGEGLSGGSGVNAPVQLNFDGAVFHGTPDQRFVNTIMNTVVTNLRNSSRTWAFNPKGQ